MPFQFRLRTMFLIVAIACVALSAYDFLLGSSESYMQDVRFNLVSEKQSPIHWVGTREFVDRDSALTFFGAPKRQFGQSISPEGKSFYCFGPCVTTRSGLGWRTTHRYSRFKVLCAHYEDGTEQSQLVEIPPGPGPHTVEVHFGPEITSPSQNEIYSRKPAIGSKGT